MGEANVFSAMMISIVLPAILANLSPVTMARKSKPTLAQVLLAAVAPFAAMGCGLLIFGVEFIVRACGLAIRSGWRVSMAIGRRKKKRIGVVA
ncbi:hypothetical protein K432DRAFT_386560 [Lepidopterella palustris CBS 459.81]|uniref:Uncharacterized protein n=1 Tax=Lepidopterella palustris CBS 459.81 TaxID=1314670 RepID=A0A8E2DZZ3_9PEZI|nr:hypothetical protein K432DRAFT_386560 [Lepidopterella palustris CBS 459.81]